MKRACDTGFVALSGQPAILQPESESGVGQHAAIGAIVAIFEPGPAHVDEGCGPNPNQAKGVPVGVVALLEIKNECPIAGLVVPVITA